jgi:Cadherin domain
VADGNGGTATQSIAVAVSGVNEAPANIAPPAAVVAEQASAGTVVAIVTASDPDAGDLFTFTLVNDGAGRFVIDPASGRLTVAPGARLDFESAPSHTLVVRVTDAQGLRTEQTIVVTLRDVIEALPDVVPPDITPPPSPAPAPAPAPAAPAIVPVGSAASGERDRNAARIPAATPSGGATVDVTNGVEDGRSSWQPQRGRSVNEGGPLLVASVSFTLEGGAADGWSQGAQDDLLLPASEGTAPRFGLFTLRGSSLDAASNDDGLGAVRGSTEETVLAALQDPVRVASVTLTAGFVWWLTRSGGLLTSILMGIPAWRHVDLLPVLAPGRDDDEEEETDSQQDEAEPSRRDSQIDDLFSNTSRMFGESRYMS